MTTTTREAALEAALKLARNRLQACAIDHPTGSREMYERSRWADEATAALSRLSTPATEPQGYVEGPQFRALKTCKGCAHFKSEYWREPSGDGETYDSGTSADCLKDGRSISTYHGSEPAPPDWCPIAARPAPQPAADTRVVDQEWMPIETAPRDGTWFRAKTMGSPGFEQIRLVHFADKYDRLPINGEDVMWTRLPTHWQPLSASAIIGTAAPAPSDKIAEAAQDKTAAELVIDAYDAANPFRQADMHPALCHCNRCAIDWLRALAGKGE